jgi:hypothetical protein
MRDNREQALDLLERFTESDDRALVEEAYETTLKYQQPVPYPPPNGFTEEGSRVPAGPRWLVSTGGARRPVGSARAG